MKDLGDASRADGERPCRGQVGQDGLCLGLAGRVQEGPWWDVGRGRILSQVRWGFCTVVTRAALSDLS